MGVPSSFFSHATEVHMGPTGDRHANGGYKFYELVLKSPTQTHALFVEQCLDRFLLYQAFHLEYSLFQWLNPAMTAPQDSAFLDARRAFGAEKALSAKELFDPVMGIIFESQAVWRKLYSLKETAKGEGHTSEDLEESAKAEAEEKQTQALLHLCGRPMHDLIDHISLTSFEIPQ